MPQPSSLEFFWDPASPYTYLAATRIEKLAEESGISLRWRPFLLGGVFKATGNRAPAEVAAKGRYLFEDLQRWASLYSVPLRFPDSFPANSIQSLRAALVAEESDQGPAFARAIMAAHWGEGRDINDAAVLAETAESVGLEADTVAQRMQAQEIKDQLRANTDEAVARGAFGAPTFFVGDAMFWGNDRLPLLKAYLQES
ncbi:2-hydroxychromene-2-carboxylate isomerase [Spectribacter hydrogenoxidans]|uniref:2-hydroxychromene-2-carboxylate isomerase n=1 Tax=Spectribacter hydrogenoxidans TaxID=3075608 RepID=A0ABU3BX82_9GAMM|nr:2-hydroxychromene-2-carboxylate isomerase [Salinisphaera sp. W335]MDT0633924.1 2-hydroxychromene-2-carboxylate isomerase [Salinisphaera sp. W335]